MSEDLFNRIERATSINDPATALNLLSKVPLGDLRPWLRRIRLPWLNSIVARVAYTQVEEKEAAVAIIVEALE